jgi:hypothetical protein
MTGPELASLWISFENIPSFFALSNLGDELQLLGFCVCEGPGAVNR